MAGARSIGIWVAVALALLASASPVAAKGPGGSVVLEARGSHGYSLLVIAGARPGQAEGQIAVLVEKPHTFVAYGAPATVTPTSLEADLGEVGHIALQLQPSGVKRTARDCRGKPVEYEGGSWVGEFEIRGEEGFTTASATRLPFTVKPFLRLICSSIGGGHSRGNAAFLQVGANDPASHLSLSAWTEGPGKAVGVTASIREQRGEVNIERKVERRFPSSAFSYAPDLSSATLRPPAPFSGHGVFRRDAPIAKRWTGNMRIDFPGRPAVPATGAPLRAELTHDEWPSTKP